MGFLRNLFGSGAETSQPKFVVKRQTSSGVYEVYKGGNAKSAKAFLATKKVDKPQYYIKVETPEGNWGVDIDGLYLEQLIPFQLDINSAQCEGVIIGKPSIASLKYAFNKLADNFVITVRCGKCNHEWRDGVRYNDMTVVRCPNCTNLNKVDSRPHIKESSGMLAWRSLEGENSPATKDIKQSPSPQQPIDQPMGVPQLAQILMNPERVEAGQTAHQLGTMTMISTKFEETLASKKGRLTAAQQLGRIGGSEAGLALVTAYAKETDSDIKQEIATSLEGLIKNFIKETAGSDALEVLTGSSWTEDNILRTSDVLFQKGISSYFGKLGGERATAWLASRLDSTNLSERITTLEALGEIGGVPAASLIVKFLDSPDGKEKQVAINALAKSGMQVGAEQVLNIFASEKDRKIRRAAARAISAYKTQNNELAGKIANLMVQSLSDDDATVRECALQWLKDADGSFLESVPNLQTIQARQKMIHLLGDQDINVRYHAIDTLGEIGTPDDISALEASLKTLKPSAVPRVKEAIKKIKQR
jgi:hypothetical protein